MKRREFSRVAGMGLVPLMTTNRHKPEQWTSSIIKPKALKAGDRIGLIAPGSSLSEKRIEKAIANLKSLGFMPVLAENARANHGYLAGTDRQRLEDLHSMFEDGSIDGIWCLRGGYGCTRLLPDLDMDLIRANPKVLIGYSDITALHQAIFSRTGLITFHGPVAASAWTNYSLAGLKKIVMKAGKSEIRPYSGKDEGLQPLKSIQEGKTRGVLLGGNLSLLAALCGTPWQPDFTNKIAFLEDVGEKPYRLDRMLIQLIQAANLDKANGIVFGQFNDCEPDADENSLSLSKTLRHNLQSFEGPLVTGFSVGHVDNQCTLPVGLEVELDADEGLMRLKESAVIK